MAKTGEDLVLLDCIKLIHYELALKERVVVFNNIEI